LLLSQHSSAATRTRYLCRHHRVVDLSLEKAFPIEPSFLTPNRIVDGRYNHPIEYQRLRSLSLQHPVQIQVGKRDSSG
jgi:hypothetical protein